MAGIEVKCVCVSVWVCVQLILVKGRHVYSVYTVKSRSRKMKERQLKRKNSESSTCAERMESTCCAGRVVQCISSLTEL